MNKPHNIYLIIGTLILTINKRCPTQTPQQNNPLHSPAR